jgi:hypothetical protein
MRLAARSVSGAPLGTASENTVPVGPPYNVTLAWTRTRLPDRVLVWGIELRGSTNIKPDLAPGMKVVATSLADVPHSNVLVYVIDARTTTGTDPGSVNAVTGISSRSPDAWPPRP